jgi:hypothetical protein
MNAPRTSTLEDAPAPVRTKLAAAWASFMFFYIYVDYLALYKPGLIDDILAGTVFKFDISQSFFVFGLTLVGIPALMIVLSTILPARASRMTNLVVASLYVPVSVFNLAGGTWLYFFGLGVVVEVAIIAIILRLAWTWPRGLPAHDDSSTAASDRGPVVRPRTSFTTTRART